MDGINKLVRDSFFLRFAANEDVAPPLEPLKNTRFNAALWGLVAVLSLILGFGLSDNGKLNAKEINAPTLPLAYVDDKNILNSDFTKPLPGLDLDYSSSDNSCSASLEVPPTLFKNGEQCIPTNLIRFSNNQYTIISNKI